MGSLDIAQQTTLKEVQAAVDIVKAAIDAGFSVDLSGISLAGKQIKRIQYKTVTLSETETSCTITSVNTARTVLIPLGYTYNNFGSGKDPYHFNRITLATSTSVKITVNSFDSGSAPVVGFAVVEFY